ncbi:MAG: hypothetical protein JSW27_15040 [Phycisphaerales bacterium]|nr:MAG: hypothetical protein JSW27_15040 [Phycisphaerales bacterium]
MDTTRLLCTLILCTTGLATADEFQANVRTTGNQCNPALAVAADGEIVLVWTSYYSSSGRSNEIIGRYIDPNGDPISDEFQINAVRAGNQTEPAIAINDAGFLFAAWQGPGADGEEDIFARILDPNGVPVTEEIAVNAEAAGRQTCPSVAAGFAGTFVVVWESRLPEEVSDSIAVYGRRFDVNGAPIGQEFWTDESVYDCRYPDVAADAAGNFTVTWLQDRTSNTICACQFDANGVPVAEPFDVSTADIASTTHPSIAMALNGDFVVVWDGDPNRASLDDIHVRCFAWDGTPRSDPFVANSLREGPQQWPQVAMSDVNEFTVVWQHEHDDPNLATDISACRFDLDGHPVDVETKLNGYVADKQRYPEVATGLDGSLIAAWESDDQDGSGYGIFALVQPPGQIVDPNTNETSD